jgi:hypothetical protein
MLRRTELPISSNPADDAQSEPGLQSDILWRPRRADTEWSVMAAGRDSVRALCVVSGTAARSDKARILPALLGYLASPDRCSA